MRTVVFVEVLPWLLFSLTILGLTRDIFGLVSYVLSFGTPGSATDIFYQLDWAFKKTTGCWFQILNGFAYALSDYQMTCIPWEKLDHSYKIHSFALSYGDKRGLLMPKLQLTKVKLKSGTQFARYATRAYVHSWLWYRFSTLKYKVSLRLLSFSPLWIWAVFSLFNALCLFSPRLWGLVSSAIGIFVYDGVYAVFSVQLNSLKRYLWSCFESKQATNIFFLS